VKEDGNVNLGSENERTEFKKNSGEIKDGIVSMSAILNKHRRGILYFGVANDGKVVGQQIGESTVRDVSQKIHEFLKPVPNLLSIDLLESDGKNYIRVTFHGDEVPYSANDKYYIRVSDEDRPITRAQLRELCGSITPSYLEWENGCTEFGVDDVNEDILIRNYEDGLKAGRITEPYPDKETVLKKFNLLRDGKLTNAGHLLFSKNKPIWLKVAMFATDQKLTFLDMNHFRGNIFECIDEGMAFISRNIRWAAEIVSLTRKDIPEVPIDAIREIVVNSFTHARYDGALTSHEIDIFPSKISVFNPGELPFGVDPEKYAKGEGTSLLRNPNIANVLLRCNKIEAFGSGFYRVISSCKKAGVKYQYRNEFEGFKFEFIRNPIPSSVKGGIGGPRMSETELKVFNLICEGNGFTAIEIAEAANVSESTVRRAIKWLTENGYIERIGTNKGGMWRPKVKS
jgi:ATP-dependent DNA helicase RecG